MKLDQSFTVQADPDVVWAALTDVMRVAPNLPGAALTEDAGDGTFKGEFKVKLGSTTAAYNGAMKIESLDHEQRVATLSARGNDKRGNGGASATIVSRVSADAAGGTRVDVETDFSITGKLARFGRGGMIQDVSNRLLREFAANLQEDIAQEAAPTPSGEAPAGARTPPRSPLSAADAPSDGGAPPSSPSAPAVPPPRPPRAPAEPIGGIGLVAGAAAQRLKAAAGPALAGFALGVLAARRFEIRRKS